MTLSPTFSLVTPVIGTRITAALRRIRRSGAAPLPTGPAASGPWAGRPDLDRDGDRVRADLRALPRPSRRRSRTS